MNQSGPEPAILVIFGITGDLSQRYLLPSLYHLVKEGLLHPQTKIVGVTRGNTTIDQLFEKVELCVNEVDKVCDPDALRAMHERTTMFQMDLDNPASYQALLEKLNAIEEAEAVCMNRLYYLSIPPHSYLPVIRLLGQNDLNASCQHGKANTRLLVEKPFGFDLVSAEELISETNKHFREEQIFRIDHYMAKDTVQDILAFRLKNPEYESRWNGQHIASIEIMAKETIGVEGRAAFYEPLGALRDFIQSHLLQILGIVTMDKPDDLDSELIHANKQAALERVEAISKDAVAQRAVRGQYKGYPEEVGNPSSTTETYAAVEVSINSPRWEGVAFRLVTGKALDERKAQVCISFRDSSDVAEKELLFEIHPSQPGRPTAYERVLVDALKGDHTVFATSGEILASWRILDSIIGNWAASSDDLTVYEPGSAGPEPK